MNSSGMNVTRREFSLTTAAMTIEVISFFIIFALGVVGNIVLVATVYKRPALHRVTNYLVCALAIGDLLTLTTYGIFNPQGLLLGDWFLGDFACLINSFLMLMCGFCELYLLVVISLDRYIACCRPLRYFEVVTPRRCAVAVASCWISAFALTLYLILECKSYRYDQYLKNCLIESSFTTKPRTCLTVAFCLSPLPCTTGIVVCQWKILKQARRVTHNTPPNVISGTSETTSGNRPRKATVTLSLITGTFFICWFPFLIVNYSDAAIDWKQSTSLHETRYILTCITMQIFLVSKFSNPVIYGIYNREFRAECKQLFPCFK